MSDYNYTLLDCNGQYYIEQIGSEKNYRQWYNQVRNDRTKDVLTNNLHNKGRGDTRNKCLKGGGVRRCEECMDCA
jgi:hypothetical protein